jgi:chromosome segregation ATPase
MSVLCRLVVLEKQLSERDQQITSLRLQLSQAQNDNSGAAQHARDAAAQIMAADRRAKNLTARNQLMQAQIASLEQEMEDLRKELKDEKECSKTDVARAAEAALSIRSLNAQVSNLHSSLKIVEHQLSEKTDEAERLRAMLAMHDDSAQTAASAN